MHAPQAVVAVANRRERMHVGRAGYNEMWHITEFLLYSVTERRDMGGHAARQHVCNRRAPYIERRTEAEGRRHAGSRRKTQTTLNVGYKIVFRI